MNNVNKAVILAGGKGTRLRPITYEMPKPLLPINRRPMINYLIDLFLENDIDNIFVLIPEKFEREFFLWKERHYPKKNITFVEEEKPRGTFGGLWHLKDELQEPFFLSNGDELKKIDLNEMIKFHEEKDLTATIALVEVENPEDYGVVLTENGKVKEFLEKPEDPPSNYISSGLYLFNPEVFDYHPGLKFCMVEKDLFPKLAEEGKLAGFKFQGEWMDCGTWGRYEKAMRTWEEE